MARGLLLYVWSMGTIAMEAAGYADGDRCCCCEGWRKSVSEATRGSRSIGPTGVSGRHTRGGFGHEKRVGRKRAILEKEESAPDLMGVAMRVEEVKGETDGFALLSVCC